MAYSLSAFIAKAGTFALSQVLSPCITIVPLEQGFEMLLNDESLKDTVNVQAEFSQAQPRLAELKQAQIELAQKHKHTEDRFPAELTDALVAFGLSLSQQPIAYVEADFFGGVGEQYGVLWHNRQVALLPSTNGLISNRYSNEENNGPINTVLRGLGVQVEKYDEFYVLGLGQERHVSDWVRRFNPHASTDDCKTKR